MRRYETLKRRADFNRLRRSGRRVETSAFSLFCDRRPPEGLAIAGISVSGSVGGAVVRNRVKRRLGAALHALLGERSGGRLLFIAKPASAAMSFQELSAALRGALS